MFIEVHKVSGLADAPLIPLAINVGDIMGVSGEAVPRAFQDPPVGTRATIFLRGYDGTAGTDGLMIHVSEHFDELVTALPDVRDTRLPEVKRAEPERLKEAKPTIDDETAAEVIRDYYRIMDADTVEQCPKYKNCNGCPQYGTAFDCERHSENDIANAVDRFLTLRREEAANA